MKGLRIYIIGSSILLLLYIFVQYSGPKPTDWTVTYLKEDKKPFGTYILNKEVSDIFPGAKIETTTDRVYNNLKDRNAEDINYLLIADELDLDSLDYSELVGFIEKGNHVFIAAFNPGTLLSKKLNILVDSRSEYYTNDGNRRNFLNPALKATPDYSFNEKLGMSYFNKLDSTKAIILGTDNSGSANFVKYNFGKGSLFLFLNPKLLTNYALLSPGGAEYASKALSYLPASKMLIWDESHTRRSDRGELLHVIFEHPPLKWAYYLSIVGLLLFVFFEMKRRQRVIPVIEPLKNSSVDFVKVVGRVYYQQRNNQDIAAKKVNYLMEYIRSNYQLKTTVLDAEFQQQLILKSGIREEMIQELLTIIAEVNSARNVSDHQLIQLNKLIEKFYKQVL